MLIVVDTFVTCANCTEAAQALNIESGVLIRQPRTTARLHGYFAGLIATNVLGRINSAA